MLKNFIDFIKSQGIIGLAIAFVLGNEVSKVVQAIVTDILNPFLGVFIGFTGALSDAYWQIGEAKIMWGNLVNALINFFLIAFVIYLIMHIFHLDTEKKNKK